MIDKDSVMRRIGVVLKHRLCEGRGRTAAEAVGEAFEVFIDALNGEQDRTCRICTKEIGSEDTWSVRGGLTHLDCYRNAKYVLRFDE